MKVLNKQKRTDHKTANAQEPITQPHKFCKKEVFSNRGEALLVAFPPRIKTIHQIWYFTFSYTFLFQMYVTIEMWYSFAHLALCDCCYLVSVLL